MDKVNKKDPALVSQVTELIQSGLNPEQIATYLTEQSRRQAEGIEDEPEIFSDEVLIASQALAFREASHDDSATISRIINDAYQCEVVGPEAFREGPTVTESVISDMLTIDTYHWTLIEAPCGRGIEDDGTILGVCCYTTDGVSRRNGEEEGNVGSIRYLAVLPRYRGVLVGHRLLRRVEMMMKNKGCVRVMVSIPEIRMSMIQWVVNRDFVDVKTVPYPAEAIGQMLSKETALVIFTKPLKQRAVSTTADSKVPSSSSIGTAPSREMLESKSTCGVAVQPPPVPAPAGIVSLPPHWRVCAQSTAPLPVNDHSEKEVHVDASVGNDDSAVAS